MVANSFFIIMDITGFWHFFEEFGAGFDLGYAVFNQDGDRVTGSLVYTEYIDLEKPFVIKVEVLGEIMEDRLLLKGQSYEIIESESEIHYCLDDRMVILDDPMWLEGHSVDDQDLEGRFLLRRIFVEEN